MRCIGKKKGQVGVEKESTLVVIYLMHSIRKKEKGKGKGSEKKYSEVEMSPS